MENILINHLKQHNIKSISKALELCLPASALIVACCICFFSRMPIPIEQPLILLLGSIFILIPFKTETIVALQRIIIFYLFCVLVNQMAGQYFSFSFLSINVNLSYSIIILLLCATGYIVSKINSTNTFQADKRPKIIHGWFLALSIIIIHIVILSLFLKHIYGYGHEHNLAVLGNLCLYFLLFLTLWENIKEKHLRQSLGLILTLFFLILTIKAF